MPFYGSIEPNKSADKGKNDDDEQWNKNYEDEGNSALDSIDSTLRQFLLEKSKEFTLPFDADSGYRATALQLTSFARPHMRAFHGSWMCFCCAWLVWFSMAPLLPIVAETMSIDKSQLWTSNVWSLAGTIVLRLLLGPLCDEHGGREILIFLLVICSIPCGLAGLLIHDYFSLVVVRIWMGCVGGTLVPAQFWITSHFAPEVSGVAMATATGWGALGGGLAQILMGSILYPNLLRLLHGNVDLAWRVALIFPAVASLSVAAFFYYYSDDAPLGNFPIVKKAGLMKNRSAVASFRSGICNMNAWILFVQFGAGLGIELTVDSGMTMHLVDRFDSLTIPQASAYASLFGLTNLFARGLGGWLSDRLHRSFSLPGRLAIHMALMVCEGILILSFVQAKSLSCTIFFMTCFAIAGQMSIGTCFGIVPYLDPRSTGTIAGIVAAGGNVGGVILSNIFRSEPDLTAFTVMGWYCLLAACMTPCIMVAGYNSLLFGRQQGGKGGITSTEPQTLLTPHVVP